MKRLRADRRVGLLLAGVVFLTFVAIGATVALPSADPAVRGGSSGVKASRLVTRGMGVYRNEGCSYCHTQSVRSTPVDAPYGKPTTAQTYAGQSPVLVGAERIGPDLAHVGARYGGVSELATFLTKRHGQMPSYGFLSKDDLNALSAYLATLK